MPLQLSVPAGHGCSMLGGSIRRPAPFLRSALCPLKQCKLAPSRRSAVAVHARYSARSGSSSSGPSVVDRVLSVIPYILPFCNSFMYGRYLFYMYPAVKAAVRPLLPAISAYHSIPFGGMLTFFALYLGVVNNRSCSRFLRFNACQALLLDVVLVLPRLLETVLTPPTSGWGLQVYAFSQSFIWIFITGWVIFGIVNSLLGERGRIPFVAEAADAQIQ